MARRKLTSKQVLIMAAMNATEDELRELIDTIQAVVLARFPKTTRKKPARKLKAVNGEKDNE